MQDVWATLGRLIKNNVYKNGMYILIAQLHITLYLLKHMTTQHLTNAHNFNFISPVVEHPTLSSSCHKSLLYSYICKKTTVPFFENDKC